MGRCLILLGDGMGLKIIAEEEELAYIKKFTPKLENESFEDVAKREGKKETNLEIDVLNNALEVYKTGYRVLNGSG